MRERWKKCWSTAPCLSHKLQACKQQQVVITAVPHTISVDETPAPLKSAAMVHGQCCFINSCLQREQVQPALPQHGVRAEPSGDRCNTCSQPDATTLPMQQATLFRCNIERLQHPLEVNDATMLNAYSGSKCYCNWKRCYSSQLPNNGSKAARHNCNNPKVQLKQAAQSGLHALHITVAVYDEHVVLIIICQQACQQIQQSLVRVQMSQAALAAMTSWPEWFASTPGCRQPQQPPCMCSSANVLVCRTAAEDFANCLQRRPGRPVVCGPTGAS